jgi:hypothetical protein
MTGIVKSPTTNTAVTSTFNMTDFNYSYTFLTKIFLS